MAKTSDVHLGNCEGFTGVYKSSRGKRDSHFGYFSRNGSVLVGHRLYVCGGTLGSAAYVSLYVCDTRTFDWSIVMGDTSSQENPRDSPVLACFVLNDTLFVSFATMPANIRVSALDLITESEWEAVKAKDMDSLNGQAVGAYQEHRGEVFLCDGEKVYVFRAEDRRGRIEQTKGKRPGARRYHSCCMSASTFFLLGGIQTDTNLYALRLQTMSWEIVELKSNYIPDGRHSSTMSFCNGRIFVFGGYPSSLMTDRFDVFEVKQNRWKSIYSRDYIERDHKLELKVIGEFHGTRAHSAIITKDKMVVLGGYTEHFGNLTAFVLSPIKK